MKRFELVVGVCMLAPIFAQVVKVATFERVQLLAYDAEWRYDDTGDTFKEEWTEPGFDDRPWKLGKGAFVVPTLEDLGVYATLGTSLHDGIRVPPGQVVHRFRTRFLLAPRSRDRGARGFQSPRRWRHCLSEWP